MFNICRVSIKNGTLKHAASAGVLRWAAKTPRRTVNCCPANASAATSTSWSATPRRRPLRRRRAPQHRRPPRRPRCRPPFPKTIATSRNRRPERRSGPALRSTILPRFFFLFGRLYFTPNDRMENTQPQVTRNDRCSGTWVLCKGPF